MPDSDEHDGGLSARYAKTVEAETRLTAFVNAIDRGKTVAWTDDWSLDSAKLAADIRLVLNELHGLKQFDPR